MSQRLAMKVLSRFLRLLPGCLLILSITSCAVQTRQPGSRAAQPYKTRRLAPNGDLAALVSAGATPAITEKDLPPYRLSFNDLLEIRFTGYSELNTITSVRPDGRISLERAGELFVFGMTTEQLDSVLTERYARFIQAPDVSVLLQKTAPRVVFLMGEVAGPGSYPIEPGMTLLRTIALAGGFTPVAKTNSVIIVRSALYGEPTAFRIDVSKFPGEAGLGNDPPVVAFDIIYVPKTFIGDVTAYMSRFFGVLSPPLDFLFRAYFLLDRTQ